VTKYTKERIMNRREFSQSIGLGLAGAAALSVNASAADADSQATSPVAKSEWKQWAQEHMRGLDNVVMPSFSPDFKSLDEEGIRRDVRQSIRQGFCASTLTATGANAQQSERMMQIVREESGNKIMTSTIIGGSPDAAIASLTKAQKNGVSYSLVTFPGNLKPETEDEVYTHFRKIADAAPIPILLYGSPVASLTRFHPSGIPISVYDRLADHPKVVGMKLTHPMPAALAFELCERLSNRLLLGPVNLDLVPVLAKHYRGIQWSGQWIADSVQSPEQPYGNELLALASQGKVDEALKVYWKMQPLIQLVYDLQARLLPSHPWAHMKYYQWATGGNGGLLPLREGPGLPALNGKDRELIKKTYRLTGITPVNSPEEEFIVGKAAYARGVRPTDLASKPLYA
jgi:4-hydroxy-tetrahydrodipicolinate synthase